MTPGVFVPIPGVPIVCILTEWNLWNTTYTNLFRVDASTKTITHTQSVLLGFGSLAGFAMCLVEPLGLLAITGLNVVNSNGKYQIAFYNASDLSLAYIFESATTWYSGLIYIPTTGKIWASRAYTAIDVIDPVSGLVEATTSINSHAPSWDYIIHMIYNAQCNRVVVSAATSFQLFNPDSVLLTLESSGPPVNPRFERSTVDESTGDFFIEDWRHPSTYKIYQVES
jgi:hypothetical protein